MCCFEVCFFLFKVVLNLVTNIGESLRSRGFFTSESMVTHDGESEAVRITNVRPRPVSVTVFGLLCFYSLQLARYTDLRVEFLLKTFLLLQTDTVAAGPAREHCVPKRNHYIISP